MTRAQWMTIAYWRNASGTPCISTGAFWMRICTSRLVSLNRTGCWLFRRTQADCAGTGRAADDPGAALSMLHARAAGERGSVEGNRCTPSCWRWCAWRATTSCWTCAYAAARDLRRLCRRSGAGPRRGIDFVRSSTITRVPQFFDAAIASAAGHPLDLTFYQSLKASTPRTHRPARRKNSAAVRVRRGDRLAGVRRDAAQLRGRSSSWTRLRARRSSSTVAVGEDCAGRAEKRDSYLHSGVSPQQIGALGEHCSPM